MNIIECEGTVVGVAASGGNIDMVRYLLSHGARVDIKVERTPFHYMAEYGLTDALGEIIAAGGEVNAQNSAGRTPLHVAAEHGNLEAARAFLAHGADPSLRDNQGMTPLDVAKASKHEEIVELMTSL